MKRPGKGTDGSIPIAPPKNLFGVTTKYLSVALIIQRYCSIMIAPKPIAHGAAHDSLLRQNRKKQLAAHTVTISHREIVLIQRNLIVPTMVLLIRPTETITMKALAPTAH